MHTHILTGVDGLLAGDRHGNDPGRGHVDQSQDGEEDGGEGVAHRYVKCCLMKVPNQNASMRWLLIYPSSGPIQAHSSVLHRTQTSSYQQLIRGHPKHRDTLTVVALFSVYFSAWHSANRRWRLRRLQVVFQLSLCSKFAGSV